jgi:hypothetical protein
MRLPPLSLLSLPLMWLPEGLRRSKDYSIAARHRAAGILDLIQTNLLPQSWLDQRPEVIVDHRMCTCTWRCCLCGTGSLCRSCRVRIHGHLRLATSASSSTLVRERNPRVWSTRVCYRI